MKREHRKSLAQSSHQAGPTDLPVSKPFDPADALMKIARMEESIGPLRREVLVHAAQIADE